eukprot:scaffold107152_cov57-Phaeocystis_antarctica.AAC.3
MVKRSESATSAAPRRGSKAALRGPRGHSSSPEPRGPPCASDASLTVLHCPSPPRRTATRLGRSAWAAQGRCLDRLCGVRPSAPYGS